MTKSSLALSARTLEYADCTSADSDPPPNGATCWPCMRPVMLKNALENYLNYKNALEMIFTIKMHWE